jgi:hypothetical protein
MDWHRLVRHLALATVLLMPTAADAQSLIAKLLRIAGLTAAPSQMRGPGDDVESGSIWIANVDQRTTRALTSEGGYRSPVFSPADGGTIFALRGDTIVRLSTSGLRATAVKAPGVVKLVGFDGKGTDELVALFDAAPAGSPLGIVSLKTGGVTPLPYDPTVEDQRRMLAQIRAQDRVYGDTKVYTKTESKRGLSRNIEWTDVYLQRANAAPQNISACDGVSCVQPALSSDGRSVAFVKAGN